MREQAVLDVQTLDVRRVVRHKATTVLPITHKRFGNETNLMGKRHPPPQIGIFNLNTLAICTNRKCFSFIQDYARMAKGQQVSRFHQASQFFW
jgi:hypothetical protein